MNLNAVVLKKGKEVIFKNKHLWIFSGAIASYPDLFENGSIQTVVSSNHEVLGHAYFNRDMSLAGRIVSFGDKDPYDSIKKNIANAMSLRKSFIDEKHTNAYRLINGEGDFLPGLVVDRYADYLVLQSYTLGMDGLKDFIVDSLMEIDQFKAVYEKSSSPSRREEKLKESVTVLKGKDIEDLPILENGLQFNVNWRRGQKTGFFLDQREMREKVRALSQGRTMLNCFSYTGGFSIYALSGGAKKVDSIDISHDAVEKVKNHLEINQFNSTKNLCLKEDVFDFLTNKPLPYDFVILDPPAFAKKKRDILQAKNGYRALNFLALSKMPSQSLLLTCSCSYYIHEKDFQELLFQAAREANREVKIISKHIQALDHPVSLFHPESDYLKSFLLYIL